jgi:hypothetical protein
MNFVDILTSEESIHIGRGDFQPSVTAIALIRRIALIPFRWLPIFPKRGGAMFQTVNSREPTQIYTGSPLILNMPLNGNVAAFEAGDPMLQVVRLSRGHLGASGAILGMLGTVGAIALDPAFQILANFAKAKNSARRAAFLAITGVFVVNGRSLS